MANPEHLTILKQGVEQWNKWRNENPDVRPDLRGADLTSANLRAARLSGACLFSANLSMANVRLATLIGADFNIAHLAGANLRGAGLMETDFTETKLSGTNFAQARTWGTLFANVDLSDAKGLEGVTHIGPSTIGIDTIYTSRGKIPEVFLRGCGVPGHQRIRFRDSRQFFQGFPSQPVGDLRQGSFFGIG